MTASGRMNTTKSVTKKHRCTEMIYDTISIECNVMSPVGYLGIFIADELQNEDVLMCGNATIPKCCHAGPDADKTYGLLLSGDPM